MARADNDSWDLASSVGATATMGGYGASGGDPQARPADQRSVRRVAGEGGGYRFLHPARRW